MNISFITTLYNEEKNVDRFLKSLLGQKKRPDEIIIVDGGSTDKTYLLLEKYAKKNRKIKLFRLKSNIAKARNFAINRAKGKIIFVSDAGCVISPDWISDTIRYFPKWDVIAGSYTAIARNDFEYFQGLVNVQKVDRPSRMSSRNIAFKKSVWQSVGGYPEDDLAGEDTLFNMRLIEKNFKVTINKTAHISWEMRPDLIRFTKQFIRYGQGDRIQGNLLRMKKNLIMVVGAWFYFAALIISAINSLKVFGLLLTIPVLYLLLNGLKFLIKTSRPMALVYIPIFTFLKRVGYIYGASIYRGTIRYDKKKK